MATVFRLPDIGEGLTEAEIIEWHASIGEEVRSDQPLVLVETDKTQAELPSPITGTLLHRGAEAGAILEVGAVLAVIGNPDEQWETAGSPEVAAAAPTAATPTEAAPASDRPRALPIVRRLAREAGVDLHTVAGTGPGGRVTREDVEAAIDESTPAGMPEEGLLVATNDEPTKHLERAPGTTVRLSPTRRAIATNMARSWAEIPHVTTFDAFDAARLLEVREALSRRFDRQVSLETLLVKAAVPVLRSYPEFNATLDGDHLTLHDRYDIAVAVDSPDGLLLAVVRAADRLSIDQLSASVDQLVSAAKERTLSREEATGGTFTISNIGAIGGGHGTPIVPPGTTAILSIGRAEDAAVVRDGAVAVAAMAPLSMSYDHRVIDGGLGRRFVADLMANLEEPALFLA